MDLRNTARDAAITAVAVSAANLLLVVVARAAVTMPTGFRPLTLAPVVLFGVLAAVGATAVHRGMRARGHDEDAFLALAAVVLTLSFLPFFALPGIPDAGFPADSELVLNAITVLSLVHVVDAAVIVGGVRWTARRA